jgi:hypothetical protein
MPKPTKPSLSLSLTSTDDDVNCPISPCAQAARGNIDQLLKTFKSKEPEAYAAAASPSSERPIADSIIIQNLSSKNEAALSAMRASVQTTILICFKHENRFELQSMHAAADDKEYTSDIFFKDLTSLPTQDAMLAFSYGCSKEVASNFKNDDLRDKRGSVILNLSGNVMKMTGNNPITLSRERLEGFILSELENIEKNHAPQNSFVTGSSERLKGNECCVLL